MPTKLSKPSTTTPLEDKTYELYLRMRKMSDIPKHLAKPMTKKKWCKFLVTYPPIMGSLDILLESYERMLEEYLASRNHIKSIKQTIEFVRDC